MNNTSTFRLSLIGILLMAMAFCGLAQNVDIDLDQLLESAFQHDQPGATVIITKNGSSIYRKAFGMANLELGVKMTPENVFEIGSITKQFTAVSILMLVEEGKLNLSDEITKFLPDYPTKGHSITVHHLLNHTSGIKSYTSMPDFQKKARLDLTPIELIDVFKDEPMDFDPGEEYLYNNSAFIILGYIIEQVTGDTYEHFVETELFKPAGMSFSRYGHKEEIIEHRASGYQPNGNEYVNAAYLSMTLPYAAGSLMSTVDDLAKWQVAINNNVFITEKSKQLAWSNQTLNNGEKINYGYGWARGDVNGHPSIEHGGGIFGFTTMGIYIPDEDLYVAVLTNSNGSNPTEIANKVAAIAIGNPYPSADDIVPLSAAQMDHWTGAYEFEDGTIRFISHDEGGQMYSQRKGGNSFKIFPSSQNTFFFESGIISYEFQNTKKGKVVVFKDRMTTSKGKEIDLEVPKPKKEISLSAQQLEQYIGRYELQPNFIIEITTAENKIFAQATGQPQFEIFAESLDHFFLKVVPASMVFTRNVDSGEVVSVTLHQNGMEIPGKKL